MVKKKIDKDPHRALKAALGIPYRMTIAEWRKENGLEDEDKYMEAAEDATSDSVVPAMCTEGCEVEPDGHCPHGCPSLLLAMGVI